MGGVEIAPTKWRERPLEASAGDIAAYRRTWEEHGLRIVALQALLFGQPELQLLGGATGRQTMLDYLRRMADLGASLGATALVFGSPKNRIRGSLPLDDARAVASEFLRVLGHHCATRGTVMCLEANPPEYGGDFITTTDEAVELCRLVDHPGIRVNGDLGGMTIAGEDVRRAIERAAPVLGHFHASEPHLSAPGAGADHAAAAASLRATGYDGWVSIEMRAVGGDGNVAAIEHAIRRVRSSYSGSSTASAPYG